MFLKMLNDKCQDDFLKLAIQLCMEDGNFGDEEQEMMYLYGDEIGKTGEELTLYYEELKNLEKDGEKSSQRKSRLRSLVENIKDNSEERGRKIILFELLGLAYADADFAEEEKEFIQNIKDVFGIEDAFVEKTSRLLESYMELQEKITKHVLG